VSGTGLASGGANPGDVNVVDGSGLPLGDGPLPPGYAMSTGTDGLLTPVLTATDSNGNPRPTSGRNPHSPSPTGPRGDGNPSRGHLSNGAIVGIVLGILVLIAFILVCLLRWRKARRSQPTHNWQMFDDDDEHNYHQGIVATQSASTRTHRNITNGLDTGNNLGYNEQSRVFSGNNGVPSLPPMAEVGRPAFASGMFPYISKNGRRLPSDNSTPPLVDLEMPTGYSERFILPPRSPIVPAINPFDDPTPVIIEDSESKGSSADGHAGINAIETVRQPFFPTLDDELAVSPGDAVRILKPFDDGWCLCELVKGEGEGSKGLIPIDSLREAGQELPAFLAARRVSSYSAHWDPASSSAHGAGTAL
jgi:hypothetical protein